MSTTIATLFPRRTQAEAAVQQLLDDGHSRDNISMLSHKDLHDGQAEGHVVKAADQTVTASEGAAAGAAGGIAGGVLAALGLAVLPGIGWVLAAGPIAAVLATGAAAGAAGAVGGAIVGAMTDNGIPQRDAEIYAEAIRRGGTLVIVNAATERETATRQTLLDHKPFDIENTVDRWKAGGWNSYDATAEPFGVEAARQERERYDAHLASRKNEPKVDRYARTYPEPSQTQARL